VTAVNGTGGWARKQALHALDGAKAAMELAGCPLPRIVCLCGSSLFYEQYQQAYYDQTMRGEIVLSVGFYPHPVANPATGPVRSSEPAHGEGVGHDSAQKVMLDELHKRKIDLADYVLVVSDVTGYYGSSTLSEIRYALDHGKPVEFTEPAARKRCVTQYRNKLLDRLP
jgi:hypothetical protein